MFPGAARQIDGGWEIAFIVPLFLINVRAKTGAGDGFSSNPMLLRALLRMLVFFCNLCC